MEHSSQPERTALVVEDDVFMLSAIAEMLSDDGYDVHTASNGFSALRQATQLRPAVLLLDLLLPERSGKDVLRDLRSDPATREMAIVVVTGHAEGLSEAQIAETDGVVVKPFDEQDLLLTVHRAIVRAAARRAEVVPVLAVAHRETPVLSWRAASARRARGRR